MTSYLRIGYRCIQGYPSRICSGCTSACCEPVFVLDEADLVTESGRVLTDEDIEALADEAERGYDVSHLRPRSRRVCMICKTVPVPAGVHACETCE